MSTTGGIKVFSGTANRALAEEICHYLSCDPGRAITERFSDGEFNFQIDENVRGGDIFIVQPTCPPTDSHLMELLVMLDAFRRSSAERVTAVIPYYGYARSDKKDRPRVPIAARLVANLITSAGADRILTMDLHAAQIQGFLFLNDSKARSRSSLLSKSPKTLEPLPESRAPRAPASTRALFARSISGFILKTTCSKSLCRA